MANPHLQSFDGERVLASVPPFHVSKPREKTRPSSANVIEYDDPSVSTTPSGNASSFQGSPIWPLRSPIVSTRDIHTRAVVSPLYSWSIC